MVKQSGSAGETLPQAIDFQQEVEALHALLASLTEDDWERPTQFKSWTSNDIVQHLHDGDLLAAASGRVPGHGVGGH